MKMTKTTKTTGIFVPAIVAATLALSGPAPLSAQQGKLATPGGRTAGPQGFSIVLVLGDMQASSAASNVPPAAQKALADMKDFLPYKGYRLLDAQWTLCCGRTPVVTRLRGPDEHEYELELAATPMGSDNVNVRFELTEAIARERTGAADAQAPAARLQNTLERLREARKQQTAKGMPANHPEVKSLDAQIAARERELDQVRQRTRRGSLAVTAVTKRRIIDTSFRMDVGETVVVGTSRIQGGDKALIALLTAVPQRGTAAR
jgi:hypothetical protein